MGGAFFVPSFAVIQGHHPLVIQGHSPINLAIIAPHGEVTGCVYQNGQFVTVKQIEGSSTSGCNTEPETIKINHAVPGVYTVEYWGTASGGGEYHIYAYTCVTETT